MINEDGLLQLTPEQLKQILERGYTYAMVNGEIIRTSTDDLYIKKEDLEKFIERKETEKKLHKCIQDGKITESAPPIEWLKLCVSEGIPIPLELEKAAREHLPNYDEYVYGNK